MTLAEKRADALALFDGAGAGADWRSIATALAGVIPRPKSRAVTAADGEWGDDGFAARLTKTNYVRGRASFTFADGRCVVVNLLWRKGKKAPDWARAARFAVRFYRRGTWATPPRITAAVDHERGVSGSLSLINAEAARYLATLPTVDRAGVPDWIPDRHVDAYRVDPAAFTWPPLSMAAE